MSDPYNSSSIGFFKIFLSVIAAWAPTFIVFWMADKNFEQSRQIKKLHSQVEKKDEKIVELRSEIKKMHSHVEKKGEEIDELCSAIEKI